MRKTGKYRLFSYYIEEDLLFYNSDNHNKGYIAFSILEIFNYNGLLKSVIDLLLKRYLIYFSLQINISEENKYFLIIHFKDSEKRNLIKFFNLFIENLNKNSIAFIILKNEVLEQTFLDIGIENINPKAQIGKKRKSILLNKKPLSSYVQIYSINLSQVENQEYFLENFLKLVRALNQKGFLIINFTIKENPLILIKINLLLINSKFEDTITIHENIDKIYKNVLIKEDNFGFSVFFNLLWRIGLNNEKFEYEHFNELFTIEERRNSDDFNHVLTEFEKKLANVKIFYKRLNKNLFFINRKYLFFIFNSLDLKMITKTFKKFYSKYFIYILVINKEDYENLVRIDKINMLEQVKILDLEKFVNLNLNNLS